MATERINGNGNGGKCLPEWQKERLEMALDIQKHILSPMATFARAIKADSNTADVDEVVSMLRLLIMGAYEDLKIYCVCSGGGHTPWVDDFYMKTIDEEWQQALAEMQAEKQEGASCGM